MPFLDLLFALLIALVLTVILSAGFRRHRGSTLLAFFLLLVVLIWAAGVWIAPVGYPFLGVYWLTYLIAGIVFAMLLVALIPPTRPRKGGHKGVTSEEYFIFGSFFWILIVALTLIILAGYALDPHPMAELAWPPEIR